ncbi:DUF86 domain-containing protein [Brevundimonas sp. SL130]|uniref:HepT-like ribonuclease domain-containing protein n=1 Tax=Brevundimonas sp. SL130 TaxID=2995143 RepID=UPI00226CAC83|nr:HepT-like ribonuclease domain-containing protein [Brevundimonas sp. SL130]WAC59298.1 DUF86 domain-containing protein [Brevundimonas sp. SL130]
MKSDRSDRGLLADIRESTELIARYIDGLSGDDFEADSLRRDATAFRLLIVGEAAGKLSPAVTDKLPDIDWRGMLGLRHRLAHDYGSTDFSVIWTIASIEAPRLAQALQDL